jgi:TetR/AcrR family transcriptional repressor of mexJK operon
VREGLRALADGYLHGLLQPEVIRLRRLVIGEADRFPDVGRAWFDQGFERTLVLLGESLQRLAERGDLRPLDDPTMAAYHFAGLVMYQPMNQALFAGTEPRRTEAELRRIAEAAVDVFLAAYG